MVVVDERGYFWWHDEPIEDGHFAPKDGVYGRIKIDNKGLIELELDGHLTRTGSPISHLLSDRAYKNIIGILKGTNEYVFLIDNHGADYSISTSGLSHEKIKSEKCVIGPMSMFSQGKLKLVDSIDFPLDGFEEWINIYPIKINHGRRSCKARYDNLRSQIYKTNIGILKIEHKLKNEHYFPNAANFLKMELETSFSISSNRKFRISEVVDRHNQLQDLIIVLTGVERSVEWPLLNFKKSQTKARLYHNRFFYNDDPVEKSDCMLLYTDISDIFGYLYCSWVEKRKDFGPAFYLYTATKRGQSFYSEHLFMNYVWGLESFHRRSYKENKNKKLDEKISRISENIILGKDRRWFLEMSKYFTETRLSDRLIELYHRSQIDIDEEKMI